MPENAPFNRIFLNTAAPKLAAAVVLYAFAGVRSEELLRLTWADVQRRKGFIEISAGKAKTAQRRLIPIPENLATCWRMPRTKETRSGRIQSRSCSKRCVMWRSKQRSNGRPMRHSFITYRLAATQDVAAVALEAGNPPTMIFRHLSGTGHGTGGERVVRHPSSQRLSQCPDDGMTIGLAIGRSHASGEAEPFVAADRGDSISRAQPAAR